MDQQNRRTTSGFSIIDVSKTPVKGLTVTPEEHIIKGGGGADAFIDDVEETDRQACQNSTGFQFVFHKKDSFLNLT